MKQEHSELKEKIEEILNENELIISFSESKNKRSIYILFFKDENRFIIFISLILLIAIINPFLKNKSKEKETKYEYINQEISYNIDMEDLNQVKDNSDVVMVGKVIEKKETEYIAGKTFKDEKGNVNTVDGLPFTNFSIKIERVIKGNLNSGEIIDIKKYGGVSQSNKEQFYIDDDGIFPEKGKTYIFFSNYQEDGTLMSFGKNTVIEFDEDILKEVEEL